MGDASKRSRGPFISKQKRHEPGPGISKANECQSTIKSLALEGQKYFGKVFIDC